MSRYARTAIASNHIDWPKVIFLGGLLLFFVYNFAIAPLCHMITGSDPVTLIFQGTIRERINEDATKYARDLHRDWVNPVIECQPQSNDGRGNAACTIGDGHGATEPIECPVTVWRDAIRGCRRATVRAVTH